MRKIFEAKTIEFRWNLSQSQQLFKKVIPSYVLHSYTKKKQFQLESEEEIFVQTFDYGAWRIISKGPLEIPNEEERWDENDNQCSIQFQGYAHTPLCYELLEGRQCYSSLITCSSCYCILGDNQSCD
ncbi:hypothetical protein J1N35_039656 [Gossypium stocksii]|uniref:Uncharacterized protein n=1 Tax=Gossypium stocksii TaxID=47602 RepID=A0A9D3UCN5_9ROSI|nr:hypothetical protein J1N35_039656 [Gossypium stocksii]